MHARSRETLASPSPVDRHETCSPHRSVSDDLPEIRRIPIRTDERRAKRVVCPRHGAEVKLEECSTCTQCVGISLRDAYIVCGLEQANPEGESADARLASEAQSLRSKPRLSRSSPPAPAVAAPLPLARFERAVVTAELDEPVLDAARRMRDSKVGCIIVLREGRPLGMLTDRDLALRVVAERLDPLEVSIADVVTYEAATIKRTDGLETAVRTMRERGVRRLPIVTEDGRVTGVVSADDLLRLLGHELALLGETIENNVDGSETR